MTVEIAVKQALVDGESNVLGREQRIARRALDDQLGERRRV